MSRLEKTFALLATILLATSASAQQPAAWVLQPERVFDGETMRSDLEVVVEGRRIKSLGRSERLKVPASKVLPLPGLTLMPGMIEGHSHLLLHPYDETAWRDQVLKESESLRVARATVHAERTLMAGFTTVRDLGSEGAGYADVGLKQAIELLEAVSSR